MSERSILQRFEQAGPLTWLLAAGAAWALLLWVAALCGLGSAVAPTPASAAAAPLPAMPPAVPDRLGPLARYADAATRPLFTVDRRPRSFMATGSDGAADEQVQSLDFILTGVLISPQVRLAILQPAGGGESQRVREGQSPEGAAGWRLVAVEPRRAVFQQGGGEESSLDLRTFGDDAVVERGAMAAASAGTAADAAATAGAQAARAAADDAADAAPMPASEAVRIEAIRKRIEARRAQLRNGGPPTNEPAPAPLGAAPRQ